MVWRYISQALLYLGIFVALFGGAICCSDVSQVIKDENSEINDKDMDNVLKILICSGVILCIGFAIELIIS